MFGWLRRRRPHRVSHRIRGMIAEKDARDVEVRATLERAFDRSGVAHFGYRDEQGLVVIRGPGPDGAVPVLPGKMLVFGD